MTVLVLAKSPVPGRSKTRLQSRWSPTQAAALAEASLADTLTTVADSGLPFEVVLDGDPGPWLPTGSAIRQQVQGSHAERIYAALRGARGPALLIGMDTPQVTAALLHVGLGALTRYEASLGLARDGGWWALGLRDPARDARLVLAVPTSTPHTGALQQQILTIAGSPPLLLPVLQDVDLPDDADDVAALCPHSRFGQLVRTLQEPAA